MSQLKRTYQRSQILSFYDLDAAQQAIATDQLDELAIDDQYVLWNNKPLPLGMFMRTGNSFSCGVYSQTAFSAYFIYINRTGEEATVVYAYN